MNEQEIRNKVTEILKKYTRDVIVWENATGDSNIIKDLNINSARIVDIVLDLEDEFEIEIDDEGMDNIISINNAVEEIKKRLAE